MNKDEMIKDIMAIIDDRCEAELGQVHASSKGGKVTKTVSTSLIAKDIYNAGYRKVADDEIVESMKTYESARLETAREILQELNNRYNECGGAVDVAIMLYDWLAEMDKKYGIEEED